jgi:hypothetical protein
MSINELKLTSARSGRRSQPIGVRPTTGGRVDGGRPERAPLPQMSDEVGLLDQVLQAPLASLGLFVPPAETSLASQGAVFNRIAGSGRAVLQLAIEPCEGGATVRMFISSQFGDWVPQDLERWGVPEMLGYSDARGLRSQARFLARALRPVLEQVDGLVIG